jgi:gas vesicle protein GvpL/GvpF
VIASDTDTAWYVYGVVPADVDAASFAAAEGVGAGRVELVATGGLAAIVGRVPLDEFGEEPLRRNLESRDWLEATARAHDRVLAEALGRTPLVPLRFGTVYRSQDGVRGMLDERATELREAIERLRGRVELGVKAFLVAPEQEEGAAPSSGREYLLRKQEARATAKSTQTEALESVRALHERLASLADDARVNPPQQPELSGRHETMLLNGAYLVGAELQPAFAAAVDDYGDERLELVVTGPWPPYNFVEREEPS